MRVYHYIAKNIPENKLSILKKLTFPTGMMWETFLNLRKMVTKSDRGVYLAKDKQKIVGWAIAFESHDKITEVHIYVSAKYRKQGIGSRILKSIKRKWGNDIRGHHYSTRSTKFFKKNKVKHVYD